MHYIQNNIIKHIKSSVIFKLKLWKYSFKKNYIIGSVLLKFIIGRQWCDSLFLLVLSLLFSVALKRTKKKKTQHLFSMRKLFPFSWIVLALH